MIEEAQKYILYFMLHNIQILIHTKDHTICKRDFGNLLGITEIPTNLLYIVSEW